MTTQATAYGAALVGLKATRVTVTARPASTLSIVGLPSEAATKEALVRLQAAFNACFGVSEKAQVTIEGLPWNADYAGLDLAIAVAILRLDRKGPKGEIMDVRATKDEAVFIGELGFDGRVRPVRGMLPKTRAGLYATGTKENLVVVSPENASEASIGDAETFSVNSLSDSPVLWKPSVLECTTATTATEPLDDRTFQLVRQCKDKPRVLLVGRPGSGKTMLARALRAAMSPPSEREALEIAEIHSAAGILDVGHTTVRVARPFRAPHHTVSEAGLVGGGRTPRPGEVSLAHGGVLFLDELPEFRMGALEALARMLQSPHTGELFPARPALVVGSANPCPCGYHGTPRCHCGESTMAGWKKRLEKLTAMFGFTEVRL